MLRCVSPYKSSLGQFGVGDVVDGSAAFEVALRVDSPGSFEVVGPQGPAAPAEPDTKAVESAPVDKMMKHRASTRKGAE